MINQRIFQPFFKGACCGLESVQKEGSPHHKPDRRRKDHGYIFLDSQSVFRYSEELISDLPNDRPAFFPFEMESPSTIRIINKKNIVSFSTAEDLGTEKKRGKKKRVNLVLVNGQAFTGHPIIDQPEYRTRVLDTFNAQENEFLQLFTDSEITYFININHVCQVIPS